MEKTIIVFEGQNLFDIALQEYGSVEGIKAVLQLNPSIDINSVLLAGQSLVVDTDQVINQNVIAEIQAAKVNTKDVETAGVWVDEQIVTYTNEDDEEYILKVL